MAPMKVEPQLKPKKESQGSLILDRYELGKFLGQGSFAKVFHAKNLKTGQSVAIKILDKERIMRGGLVAHTKREIAVLRRVRHPNIVHLFEVLATKSKIYFVMEYVRGGELFSKVRKGRLNEEAARRYLQQLVSAVGFCHARGVFHRDLKPENLLLDEKGDLKVSDFGLSAVSDQIRQDGLFHTFCGTPAYVAPEVLSRKGYDGARVDIWSCGIILFVLLAGYLPFHDQNIMMMYRKIYIGEFRCPKWFSPDLCRLLFRLLDTNPQTRITIPQIMEDAWFKIGFRRIQFYIENGELHNLDEIEETPIPISSEPPPSGRRDETSDSGCDSDSSISSCPATMSFSTQQTMELPRPATLNAFDIISFSHGFNLSGLFEERGEESRLVSGEPVSIIIARLEEIAKLVSFTVRKKDFRVSMEGTKEGEKGPLTIAAEIFELTPSLVLVEVKKKAGDTREYEEFYNMELKPGLQSLTYVSAAPNKIATNPTD